MSGHSPPKFPARERSAVELQVLRHAWHDMDGDRKGGDNEGAERQTEIHVKRLIE
jgi:hypothetical protein